MKTKLKKSPKRPKRLGFFWLKCNWCNSIREIPVLPDEDGCKAVRRVMENEGWQIVAGRNTCPECSRRNTYSAPMLLRLMLFGYQPRHDKWED